MTARQVPYLELVASEPSPKPDPAGGGSLATIRAPKFRKRIEANRMIIATSIDSLSKLEQEFRLAGYDSTFVVWAVRDLRTAIEDLEVAEREL